MNLVDVEVIEVIEKPHQKEDGKWSTTVVTICWGNKKNLTITDYEKNKVEMYKVGFTWKE